MSAVLVSKAL